MFLLFVFFHFHSYITGFMAKCVTGRAPFNSVGLICKQCVDTFKQAYNYLGVISNVKVSPAGNSDNPGHCKPKSTMSSKVV